MTAKCHFLSCPVLCRTACPTRSALTLDGTLAGPSPEEAEFQDRKMPLTW